MYTEKQDDNRKASSTHTYMYIYIRQDVAKIARQAAERYRREVSFLVGVVCAFVYIYTYIHTRTCMKYV